MKIQSDAYFLYQGKVIYCKIIEENKEKNITVVESLHPVNEDLGFIKTDSQIREIFRK